MQIVEGEEVSRRGIPGQEVPAAAGDVGGLVQTANQPIERCRNLFLHEAMALWTVGERAQVGVLGSVQAESSREGVDRRHGRADTAPLLQPHVPVDTYTRALRNLVAPQARRAPLPYCRDRKDLWVERRTSSAEEVAKGLLMRVTHRSSRGGWEGQS